MTQPLLSDRNTFKTNTSSRPSRLRIPVPRHHPRGSAESVSRTGLRTGQVDSPGAAIRRWLVRGAAVAAVLIGVVLFVGASAATAATAVNSSAAQAVASAAQPAGPSAPGGPTAPAEPAVTVTVGAPDKPSESIVILMVMTVMSVAPALLLLCTSFTKIFVVLSITRNALGLTSVPPNQVLAGLALFLSLFIMGPTAAAVNEQGIQPYLHGEKSQSQAFKDGVQPLRKFMLKQTRAEEIALFTKVSGGEKPASPEEVPLTTLVPAFALSELRAAMLIGFVLFIPFLVIDMVVSASLMSLGMMMLPPVTVALPFKLLLFVLANGWGLIVTALVGTYS